MIISIRQAHIKGRGTDKRGSLSKSPDHDSKVCRVPGQRTRLKVKK